MNKINIGNALRLYLVTDRTWLGDRTLEECIEQAIIGGATMIQLREKTLNLTDYISQAHNIKKITDKYGIPLIINDNCEVAKAVGAAGVHLGQTDGCIAEARATLGDSAIIGVSARTVPQAIEAQKLGADYLGVGAVFGTTTKDNATTISPQILAVICDSIVLPVVAIGGVNASNIALLKNSGANGVAVISSALNNQYIDKAVADLRKLADTILG